MGRLTDNDKVFGPLTVGRSDWNAFRLVYRTSGDRDEVSEKEFKNNIVLQLGKLFIGQLTLPNWVKPYKYKVVAKYWSADDVKRMGRDYYYSYIEKQYGFCFTSDSFELFYGTQFKDSKLGEAESKSYFNPLNQHRLHLKELKNPSSEVVWQYVNQGKKKKEEFQEYLDARQKVLKSTFLVKDYDSEQIVANTYIERRVYKRGEGKFRFLSWFIKDLDVTNLEIEFEHEIGRDKGSWKGGLMCTSIEMLKNETPKEAFKRFCDLPQRSKNGKFLIKLIEKN